MTDKAFKALSAREVRRFHRAVGKSIDSLLVAKYEATRDVEEYRSYARTCELVRSWLTGIDRMVERAEPLFEETDGRSTWEVYLSGLRRLFREMPDSYLFRYVLPMFGLEDVREKVTAYSGKWLEQTHAAHRFLRETERHLTYLRKGSAIAAEYGSEDRDLVRLYASLKTWQTQAEMDSFLAGLDEFLASSVEVFIAGPIQLYLMLGRDSWTLIFKALTVGRLSDLSGGSSQVSEVVKLSDFLHDTVANSETVSVLREVSSGAVKEYVASLRGEQERLRAQLPNRSLRQGFIQRFEAGVLFTRTE